MKINRQLLAVLLTVCMLLTSFSSVLATTDNDTFADVKAGDWYYDAVSFVKDKGLMNGISDAAFAPDGTTTRGMIVTILWRMSGSPKAEGTQFDDVSADYYAEAILWASANGIVTGYGNGKFGPDDNIIREQLAAILYRYSGEVYEESMDKLAAFTDADKISDYAKTAFAWANAKGLITGMDDGSLAPQGGATRAQVATVLHRMHKGEGGATENPEDDKPDKPDDSKTTYIVTFDLNYEGKGAYKTVEVESGKTVSNPGKPNRSQYTFDGWFTEKEGGEKFSFSTPITKNITVYAQWSKKNVSTGGGGGGSHSHSYGAWTPNNDGTHSKSCACGSVVTEDCTLTLDNPCGVCGYKDGKYHIATVAELTDWAALVNGGNDFSGKTVVLEDDVDLTGAEWTSVGPFRGTFDGQGNTISNLTVNGTECVGLFGSVVGTIKNVVLDTASITGNHYVGGIAGYAYGEISGCTVKNVTITATPNEVSDGIYDNGDKVGGIVGYLSAEPTGILKDNTVEDVTLAGYRDIGGVAGMVNTVPSSSATVSGNEVTGVDVVADQTKTENYGYKTPNAGTVVGRIDSGDDVVVESNTVADDVTVTVKVATMTEDEEQKPVVAAIGSTTYSSLSAAIEDATNGAVINVLPVEITEPISPWSGDSTHASEKSITILGANYASNPSNSDSNNGTVLTGGMYLGYDDSKTRNHTITVKGITFKGKGLKVADQTNVVIENNKFLDITEGDAITVLDQEYNGQEGSVIVKNNYIDGVTESGKVGINLRNPYTVLVSGNTVKDTKHNAITIQKKAGNPENAGAVSITDNILEDWGVGGEGRALRAAFAATEEFVKNVVFTGNTMTHSDAPEEFVKITGANGVEIADSIWNSEDINPVADYVTGTTPYILVDGIITIDGVRVAGVSDSAGLVSVIENTEANAETIIYLQTGEYAVPQISINNNKNITILPAKNAEVTFDGQFFANSGELTIKGITITNENATSAGNSKSANNAVSAWGTAELNFEDVKFELKKDSGIVTWWDTDEGTTVNLKRCTFNANGYRPLQLTANANIEGCTFNNPYRYAAQLTANDAEINFKNNTINKTHDNGKPVYAIQLTCDYGNSNLVINGEGNEINRTVGDYEDALYVWEPGTGISNGFVDIDTIELNAEDGEFKALIGDKLCDTQDGGVVIETAEELSTVIANGASVVIADDVETTTTAAGYGQADIVQNGGTIDGNNKTLSVAGDGDYSAILTSGGEIKNLAIDNGFRAIFLADLTEDMVLNNVKSGGDGVAYAINTGTMVNGAYKLIATDCEFNGWSSFAALESASFENCSFGQGTYYGADSVYGRVIKPYVETVFTGCDFVSGFYIDLSMLGCDGEGNEIDADAKITLDNCKVDGVVITADNYADLLEEIELRAGKTLADCVIFK